jgi:uncharacterized membrane protein
MWLIVGLVVFLGAHSVRIFADGFRTAQIARLGLQRWKGIYTLVSIAGFVLLVWGFGQARQAPVVLWTSMAWTHYVTASLTLPAFVLVAAAYVPGNRIKAKIGHPMVAGVKTWAFAHLMSAFTLADVVLFGSFFVWSVLVYISSRGRDRAAGTTYPPGTAARDAVTCAVGGVAWILFGFWLHEILIGYAPFGA